MRGKKAALFLGAGVAGLALIAGGGYTAHKAYAAHKACESVRAYAEATGSVQAVGDGTHSFTVLGDSYSTGDLLDDRADAWTVRFAADEDAAIDVVAQGGTGYLNAGFCGDGSFADRAAAIPDDGSTLIIEGGLNDVGRSKADLAKAADDLFDRFASRHIIVVGPVNAPAVEGEAVVDNVLARSAARHDATYVSALRWRDLQFGPDGKHLTAAGHGQYAADLAADIRS